MMCRASPVTLRSGVESTAKDCADDSPAGCLSAEMFSPKSTNLRSKKAGIGMESKALYLRRNSSYFFIFFAFGGQAKHADRNYCCSTNRWRLSPRMNFQGKPHTIYRRRNFFRHKQLTTRPCTVLFLNGHQHLQD